MAYQGALDRHLPEGDRLNMSSWSHIGGQHQKLFRLYLGCFTTSELHLEPNTTYYTGTVQSPRQLGNLNLPMKHKPLIPHLLECFDGNEMKLLIRENHY